jgi:hypothetical protein
MSTKNRQLKFLLEENDGVVVASLEDENDMSLHHTISGMPNPRIRAPRQTKDELEAMTHVMASIHHKEPKEFLAQNIEGVSQQINKHIHEIRKSLKRMQSLTHYVVTAKEVLDEME